MVIYSEGVTTLSVHSQKIPQFYSAHGAVELDGSKNFRAGDFTQQSAEYKTLRRSSFACFTVTGQLREQEGKALQAAEIPTQLSYTCEYRLHA